MRVREQLKSWAMVAMVLLGVACGGGGGEEPEPEQPGQKPDPLAHALRQRKTHQRIPAVDDQLGQDQFPQGSCGHDYRQARKLTGAGHIGQ